MDAIVAAFVWVVGLVMIWWFQWRLPHQESIEAEYSIPVLTGKLLFGVGYLASFAAMLIPAFKIKCPQCGKRTGPVRKNWTHCPFCGVQLGSELQTQSTEVQPFGPDLHRRKPGADGESLPKPLRPFKRR